MIVDIRLGEEFKRQFKRLKKKYPSLTDDLKIFSLDLRANPQQGVSLGARLYKVRMAIAAKGKGKSGGARVITYRLLATQERIEITLLTIYDKNEIDNLSDDYLRSLVKDLSKQ
ncbi:addiction module toxin RelE [Tannerella sp. oral taxon 808]|nr:addiction module toxin RelE [Tannerella sp. oral taxon 808]